MDEWMHLGIVLPKLPIETETLHPKYAVWLFFLDLESSSYSLWTTICVHWVDLSPLLQLQQFHCRLQQKHLEDDVSDMCVSLSSPQKADPGKCAWLSFYRGFCPSGPRTNTHVKRLRWMWLGSWQREAFWNDCGCELSDLCRGMFEVAPRSAVIRDLACRWEMWEKAGSPLIVWAEGRCICRRGDNQRRRRHCNMSWCDLFSCDIAAVYCFRSLIDSEAFVYSGPLSRWQETVDRDSIGFALAQSSTFITLSCCSPPTSTASISATSLASASIRPWISFLSSVLSCPNSHSSCIWRVRVKMSSLARIWKVCQYSSWRPYSCLGGRCGFCWRVEVGSLQGHRGWYSSNRRKTQWLRNKRTKNGKEKKIKEL